MPGEKLIQTANNWLPCTKYLVCAGLLWYIRDPGPDPGFAKRGGRVSKLRENWLIWSKNRLNLHDLVVKRGGGAGAESAHTWIRPWDRS